MAAMEKFFEGPLLADWVRSPTAALRKSNSKNLGLADWPLSGKHYGSFGSMAVLTAEASRVLQSHWESPRLNYCQAVPLRRVARRKIPATHLPDLFDAFGG